MSKRKFSEISTEASSIQAPKAGIKNSLDSDEDDDEVEEETYNIMDEDEFEGLEDGPSAVDADVGFTAFNMKEELEEGHFDKEGHYLWKKEKQIKDHWLDNIDWVQVQPNAGKLGKGLNKESKGLADSGSDSDDDPDLSFDPIPLYKQILEHLKRGETVSKALCRLGKGKKQLTTAERWKRKKDPKTAKEDEEQSAQITKLTELANELLSRTGNMDIYQESYELITKKIDLAGKQAHPSKQEAELDMYADDFDTKEKKKLVMNTSDEQESETKQNESSSRETADDVTWDLKWSQNENAEINGPHTTQQMFAWAKEGYFKKGAWVRRTGQLGQFYSAARVDFELYL